jgi:hypothetical protein
MDTKFREQQWNTFICNPRAWALQKCGLGQRWLAKWPGTSCAGVAYLLQPLEQGHRSITAW